MIELHLTGFECKFDNNIEKKRHTGRWNGFVEMVLREWQVPTVYHSKDDLPAVVFVKWLPEDEAQKHYRGYAQRVRQNMVSSNVLTLDIEQMPGQAPITLEFVKDALKEYEYIAYTTFSHLQPGKGERYRVLLPMASDLYPDRMEVLARKVPRSEPAQFTGALTELFPFCDWPVVSKPLQIAYLPGVPNHAAIEHYRCWHNSGKLFDHEVLPELPPVPKYQGTGPKGSSTGTGPAILSTFDLARWFDDLDLIQGGNERVLQVQCPFSDKHSSPGGSALVQGSDGKYGFNCFHSSCANMNGANLLKWIQEHDPHWEQYCERYEKPFEYDWSTFDIVRFAKAARLEPKETNGTWSCLCPLCPPETRIPLFTAPNPRFDCPEHSNLNQHFNTKFKSKTWKNFYSKRTT